MSQAEETPTVAASARRESTARAAGGNTLQRALVRPAWMLVLLAGIPLVIGLLGGWGWPWELATHFRVQYALALGVAAAILLAAGRFRQALVPSALLLACAATIVPLYLPVPHVAGQQANGGVAMRLLVLNVLTENRRYGETLELVHREQPDVVLLLEVNREWVDALTPLQGAYPNHCTVSREDNFGIACYRRLPCEAIDPITLDGELPALVARLPTVAGTLTLIGAHTLPPVRADGARRRNRQLAELAELAQRADGPVVLAGDLNCTSWSPRFGQLLDAGRLRDSRLGFGVQATWPAHAPALRIPIDHVLVSHQIVVRNRRVAGSVGSDHLPVVVDLEVMPP